MIGVAAQAEGHQSWQPTRKRPNIHEIREHPTLIHIIRHSPNIMRFRRNGEFPIKHHQHLTNIPKSQPLNRLPLPLSQLRRKLNRLLLEDSQWHSNNNIPSRERLPVFANHSTDFLALVVVHFSDFVFGEDLEVVGVDEGLGEFLVAADDEHLGAVELVVIGSELS